MKNKVIEIQGLTKKYKKLEVLKDISFDVEEGSLFSYLGLNGAGKSTTINILCQVLERDSGEIKLMGLDIDKNSKEIKKSIGIVFQNSCLDKELSILSNLKNKAYLFGINKKQFIERLEFLKKVLDLDEILKRRYSKLSGGQKRRADIAYGLINEPKILFLDEPTTGLDPINREKVWKAIMFLVKEKHITVFLTTHYMEEAEYSDKVIILDEGKIAAQGTPVELKDKYSSSVLKVYLENTDENTNALKNYFGNVTYINDYYSIMLKDFEPVLNASKEIKGLLKDIELIKGNMQSVFVNVTGKKAHNE